MFVWRNRNIRTCSNYSEHQRCKSDTVSIEQQLAAKKQKPEPADVAAADTCVCSTCTDLPHSDHSVSDEDQEDDEGLHEGGDGLLALLKPSQHLRGMESELALVAWPRRSPLHGGVLF